MGKKDPRVDAYIAAAADFAKPILRHVRTLVHRACPDVEEKMKWSFPHFDHEGTLCSFAAFKGHCAFGFWKGSLIVDKKTSKSAEAMGQFGRLTSVEGLPDDATMLGMIREAARLNDKGIKVARVKRPRAVEEAPVPKDLSAALRRNAKARATFQAFSPSKKREYVEWITEAKTAETRKRRLDTAVAWMSEGKSRNWKYVRK